MISKQEAVELGETNHSMTVASSLFKENSVALRLALPSFLDHLAKQRSHHLGFSDGVGDHCSVAGMPPLGKGGKVIC